MSDQVQDGVFGRATTQCVDSSSAQELTGQTGTSSVHSMLFDDLRTQAGSGAALQDWRVQVLTLPLTRPTRRRVRVTLRGQLVVVRMGQARASLSCESRRASAHVLGRERPVSQDGALPTRERSLCLSFTLPRSVRPRTHIRLQILLEADALNPECQAEAVVDSLDVEAR
jgi:hypothetical protein